MKKILLALFLLGIAAISCAETPAKITLCAACHGPTGLSSNPEWPNISGQNKQYLIKQLEDFKEGKTRDAATMAGISASLDKDEMIELANFYANQPPPQGLTPEKFLKRGERLYRGGDFAKHITACIACHGPQGTGNGQAGFPALSGQHAFYTLQQLQAFKDHKRSNDLNSIMQDISAHMSQEDMEAVAYYIQGLY